MSRASLAASLVGSFVLALLVGPACSDPATDQPCSSIPAGGCPLSHGRACEDPSCEAVYACRAGNVWELDHSCPPRQPAALHDAAVDPPSVLDAAADAPPGANGGPGCAPLQAPDCALASALVCPSGCCDCEDLFVCQSGGWVAWGTCSLDAGVREAP